jgi:ferredoxin
MGLTVGVFGGETVSVLGVIPLPGTGGIVLIEDVQKRIHRIHGRAIVRVCSESQLPDPFAGWLSPGLVPVATAERLAREAQLSWDPSTVILGTGNRGLRFGSSLLEAGAAEVYCVETFAQWGAKRFAGWEVERRRFEAQGGRILEARPVRLTEKAPMVWELRLRDDQGVRVIECARVVSAGPFAPIVPVREHPPGSLLFELEQTAALARDDQSEGWVLEEERGKLLAGKIVKRLVTDLGPRREELERVFRRAKGRLKRYQRHREQPFTPAYQGKWTALADARRARSFSGVPQKAHASKLVASIECFEEIPCNACETACPEDAITIGRVPRREAILRESACTGCGLCLQACPSGATLLVNEREDRPLSRLVLPWRGSRAWNEGEFATLVNRRGETLGSARVTGFLEPVNARPSSPEDDGDEEPPKLVQLEVPAHLLWEARGLRRPKTIAAADKAYLEAEARTPESEKIEVSLDGDRRLVRDKIPATLALFETGRSRSEDALFCPDGSCGRCQVSVDGVHKLACRTQMHRGMVLKAIATPASTTAANAELLCPCLGITREQVVERLRQGRLQSPEAVLAVTHVGEGRCHGQLCLEAFRRVLLEQGLDVSQWIDWRFPWADWVLTHG